MFVVVLHRLHQKSETSASRTALLLYGIATSANWYSCKLFKADQSLKGVRLASSFPCPAAPGGAQLLTAMNVSADSKQTFYSVQPCNL